MTERRRWKAEEKLAIIKEAKESSSVAEVCRKHSIDPSMLTGWRESYETFGLEGLRTHSTAIDPGLRKLKKENEKLKKLLAEKELENALLSYALKKDGEETMILAKEYMNRGLGMSDITNILHIPRCSFYRNVYSEKIISGRGRSTSSFTLRRDGNETTIVDNSIIVNEREKLLSREFICYGYKKTTKHLNRLGYKINRKKVRRLMA